MLMKRWQGGIRADEEGRGERSDQFWPIVYLIIPSAISLESEILEAPPEDSTPGFEVVSSRGAAR